MSDNTEEQKAIEQVYAYVVEQKKAGKSDTAIQNELVDKGIEEETAKVFIDNANKLIAEHGGDESSGISGWLIWILILGGINLLSYIFDWPFWIY